MALNNIIRKVSSSKVVPLTFHKAARGSQRYLHHHFSAVLSTAGTLNRGSGSGNLCSTVNIFKHALPSTLHHLYSTKSVIDESLIQIFDDTIKSFKGTEAERIQEEDFPFVIVDRDEKSITLSREYQGEMVDVDVYLSKPDSEAEDENETEDDDKEEEEDKEQVYHLWVKVSKKDRSETLEFNCTAYLDLYKISIDEMFLRFNHRAPDIFEHGILQKQSGWADGANYVTQCPILPEKSYTYRFNIIEEEGTLWWHAHASSLRATVYGPLIILPRLGHDSYPFLTPHNEFYIILEEYWDANVVDVENQGLATGGAPNVSNSFTINGQPGALYPCSAKDIHKIEVVHGETYLLRIVNAALNNQLFFKIANHKPTVVTVDACYINPYITDVVVIAPGQTADVILSADQPPALYYMAAHPYFSAVGVPFDNTTTTGIVAYRKISSSIAPIMPILPAFNDTPTAHKFYSNLTGLVSASFYGEVIREVDEDMFITIGLGLAACGAPGNASCVGPLGQRFAASMNNASFQLPSISILQAFFQYIPGIYTADFPDQPPVKFDYTNANTAFDPMFIMTTKSTKVKFLKFNSTVQIVLQNTALIGVENHPMHLHGHNFYVLAQAFGNFNPTTDTSKFNLINPQLRNTIAVPVGGWSVIRFRANNPGAWMMHCHLDVHLPWGLAMVFVVGNGGSPSTTLPPPPPDFPKC